MLLVAPEYQAAFKSAGLNSVAAVIAFFCGDVSDMTPGVHVWPGRLDMPGRGRLDVFFKLYLYGRPSWRFWARPSKARCEYRNYGVFEQLRIPSARRVACGEARDGLGRLRCAFILTEAIPEGVPLPEFWSRLGRKTAAESRPLRREIVRQLAEMTHRAHAAGFFHHDLVWRNVLVTHQPPDRPQLWWIDCPRGGFDRWSPCRAHRRVKDLASLDKLASRECRAVERVAFLKWYLGLDRLSPQAKALARQVVRYRRRRWPDEWR